MKIKTYMKKILYSALISALCLVSCKPGAIETQEYGIGTLSFRLNSLEDYITVNTKAGVDYTDFSNYDVVINGPTVVKEKYSEFSGRVVELGSGEYTITVTSPGTEPAAFEQPIYRAYEEFQIRAGEVTSLDLVCTPYNCKVTIELSENFKKELATYEVVVNNGLGQLVWTKDATKDDFASARAGYFLPRGLEVFVKGHRAIDNTEATAVYYVKNPVAGEHHVIKLDAKVTGVVGGITIDVLTEFNEVDNNIDIDGIEDSYVDRPDFGDGSGSEDDEEDNNAPSIIWEDNPFFDPISINSSTQVSMTINAPLGFKSFIVEVSDNFKPAISVFTQSSEIDYIDLINHPNIWSMVNLPVGDQVAGQTTITFDLTAFVPTLCSVAKGMTVEFVLKASDIEDNYVLVEGEFPVVTMSIPE